MRMPFGKFCGRSMCDVDRAYLCWVLNNCRRCDPRLRRAIAEELDKRVSQGLESEAFGALADVAPVIRTWFREMTLKFHPDRGGNHAAMIAINHAHDRLRELTGLAG